MRTTIRPLRGRASECLLILTLTGFLAPTAVGQTPLRQAQPAPSPALAQAAATISTVDVARMLAAFASDSLRDRAWASRGLEAASRYVAAELRQADLEPGVKEIQADPTWFQRYRMPGQLLVDTGSSTLWVLARPRRQGKLIIDDSGRTVSQEIYFVFSPTSSVAPGSPLAYFTPQVGHQTIRPLVFNFNADPFSFSKDVIVIAGPQTVASLRQAAPGFGDRAVLYVPAAGLDSATRNGLIRELYHLVSQGVLIVGDDSISKAADRSAEQRPPTMADHYLQYQTIPSEQHWAVTLAAEGARRFLAAAGLDLAALRTDTTVAVREVPFTQTFLFAHSAPPDRTVATAPNVIGLLEGTDPELKDEYVVLSARLDSSTDSGSAGSAQERAVAHRDDDASGIVALLAVAKAFSQPGVRPRRSVLFLAMTRGAEDGFWGARYFVGVRPPWTRDHFVADLHLGSLMSATSGSVAIDGSREVDLIRPPAWVAASHPELELTVIDGGSVIRPTSDHYGFVRFAVPSLYLHGVTEGDAPPVRGATPDADHIARVARYVLYLAQDIANAPSGGIRWNPTARTQLSSDPTP